MFAKDRTSTKLVPSKSYFNLKMSIVFALQDVCLHCIRWCSRIERSHRMRKVGCSNPRQWQLHCQTLSNRCDCRASSEMIIIYGTPVSNRCGTLKNAQCTMHMAMSAEYRSKFEALHFILWRLYIISRVGRNTVNKQTYCLDICW